MSGQAPLALDVAILLPAALRQYLSRLNAELAPPPVGFHFDDTHLPHMSLAQIFVRAADLDDAIAETERTLHEVRPLTLQMARLSQGGTTSVIRVSSTPALLALHTALMDRLRAFEIAPGDAEAFVVDREAPRPDDVRWVEQFRDAAAYDNFDPHITLGVGPVTAWTGLTDTTATDVAVCHLGRFCTCRRALARWTLTPSGA